jgi:hypothetical protein
MSIERLPGVDYRELDSNPINTGEGSQIPIFIAKTKNTAPNKDILKFKNYAQANRTVEAGGIGTDETDLLNITLKEFFKENVKKESEDLGVNYVYVIDLGKEPTNQDWLNAFESAKIKREVEVEIYVNADDIALLESANESIIADSRYGSPRIGYSTISEAKDEDLIKLTDDSETQYIQRPRIAIIEPLLFGKILARICTTPSSDEPGYPEFRSVQPGEFIERTEEEMLDLQNAGIIFGRDELTRKKAIPRINLGVSTAFAAAPDNRSNDSLLHARRNTDAMIRAQYDIAFTQLKRNETEVNITHLQTDIDADIDERIRKGIMMAGNTEDETTRAIVEESISNPYDIIINGNAVPVNSTLNIEYGVYVSNPNIKAIND